MSRRDHQIDRRFAYGRELRPTAINEFVADTITMPVPDRYKSIRHDIDGATSHGAHMLSVAAGWPDLLADAPNLNRDAAAEADIVFVQLPARTVADTNGNSLGAHVFSALQYIASRTALSAKVVANLSYGSYAGPHDGSSLIEKAINKFVHDENAVRKGANGSFDLVIAAGNGYQSASHARVKLTNTKPSVNVPFRVMPDDTTWTFIEVWYRQSSGVTVAVQPPGSSKASSAVGPNSVQRFGDSNEPTCVIVHAANASSIGEIVNSMALVAIAPTRRLSGTKKAEAPYGVWQLVLNYDGRGEVQVDAWIERDEPILEPTFPKRQATFVVDAQPFAQRDDDYPRISHATKEATVNSIATGYANNRNVHIVGATVASSGHFSDYSPAGDITPGKCPAPSALAEADENDVLYGRLVYGNYDSVVVRRSGTSIAAAMHSRKLLNDRASGGSAARAARPPASPPSSLAATTSPLAPARGGKAHDAQ
ncbi:MAG: hypothetical protein JNL19_10185 [Burkholderiales bacterium]|nr:hypothetical protein [Burkholderiales bacterium]